MRRYLAELVGTFVLVFGGCGAAVLAGSHVGYLGVSLAFGLALLAMVYAVGPVSGCHVNPAVSLGLLVAGKMDRRDFPGYVAAQVAGAVLAAAVLRLVVADAAQGYDVAAAGFAANGYGAHSPGGYGVAAAFVAEAVLTAFLVLTVLGATDVAAPVGFAGLAIGLVLALIHLVGIPVTNTSVNPARSIGPALFVGGWALQQLWLFVVAPLVGAVLAALVHRGIHVAGGAPFTARGAQRALESQQAERRETITVVTPAGGTAGVTTAGR